MFLGDSSHQPTSGPMRVLTTIAAWICASAVIGCGAPAAPPPETIHLTDLFTPQVVVGATGVAAAGPRTEWRFDGAAPQPPPARFPATRGWEASPGVSGLAIRDGLLTGRTTTDFPIVRLERTAGLDNLDQLHSIEVRMRASAGRNLSIETWPSEGLDFADALIRELAWEITTPIRPGDDLHTYVLTKARPLPASQIRYILIRPTDVGGASFDIESVRLIFRKEYLAEIPSGIGWQGMKEVYRESLVARAPEQIRLNVRLPPRPWLDLAVGTLDETPVTFRVSVTRAEAGRTAGRERLLLEQTLTTPYRWEPCRIDLSAFAGESVVVSLALAADRPGAIGVWGSPVLRNRLATSPQAASASISPQDGSGPPQGIILIQADTLRRDHLDVYGYRRKTAPVLSRMAAEGTLFRNFTTQATWTKVSTPSLLTSLYPTTHGVLDFNDRLPASATTLAEVYRAGNYATLAFASNLYTGQFTNLHQGFDELHEDGSLSNPYSSKTSREYVDRLVAWLEQHRDTPFFIFFHAYDPHDPYEPQPPYDTLWANPARKAEHTRQVSEVRKVIQDPLAQFFGMPTREELLKAGIDPKAYIDHERDWYDGSIRGMDVELGRLFERLRTLGLDKKTLVVFTADHGEEFLDHGRTFHGQSVYGELTLAPLIMRWPGRIPAGKVIDEAVQTIDLMPTLLDISRLPHPKGLQGQSLLPLLTPTRVGDPGSWRARPTISLKAKTEKNSGAPPPAETESFAIVHQGWKLIHHRIRPAGYPEFELFDVARDPLNHVNLASQHPDVVTRLGKALDGWREMAQAARLKPDAETTKGLSQEQLQRLRSLGYIR